MVMHSSGENSGLSTNANLNTLELSTLSSGSQQIPSSCGALPPVSVLHPKERLNQWLDENPSSPHIPEENMTDPLQRRVSSNKVSAKNFLPDFLL